MIYVLYDGENYKVGYTSRDVMDRARELQSGNPRQLKLIGLFHGTPEKEKEIHKTIGKNIYGEWFEEEGIVNIHELFDGCKIIPTEDWQRPDAIKSGGERRTL